MVVTLEVSIDEFDNYIIYFGEDNASGYKCKSNSKEKCLQQAKDYLETLLNQVNQ